MPRALAILAATLLLSGCPYLGEERYQDEIRDFDQDGVEGTRFGGEDCRDDDPSVSDCDADGDGFDSVAVGGTDCNDADATIHPDADEICDDVDNDCDGAKDDADDDVVGAPSWYADDDQDGYGSASEEVVACLAPSNHVDDDRDCDDDRADVHPGAVEFCDAVDRDCNGDPVANAVDPVDWYLDADGDGFGFGASVALACTGPADTIDNALDCDDTSALAYPGATETWYDGVDADCDGGSDYDQDGDGVDRMPEGNDCDDANASINPSADERCNGGVDDDCDGLIDDQDPSLAPGEALVYHLDADGDGHGSIQATMPFCSGNAPAGWLLDATDCDDSAPNVFLGGTEVCDLLDNDCDGVVDDGALDMVDFFVDADGDGWGGDVVQSACSLEGGGLSNQTGDCNDADPATYPGAPEICGDLFRQDCSGLPIYDCDGDGYEDVAEGGTDCDDTRADVSPGATEVCDGADNDCDLLIDSDDPSVDLNTAADWYRDDDGDGFGGPFLEIPSACAPIPGAAPNSDDCDDTDANTYPGAVERCDGVDNSCEGTVDEQPLLDAPTYHYDADGDGFGNPGIQSVQGCDPPSPSWVLDDTDCADGYASVNPLAVEICDGLDNDCNGDIDAADPGAAISVWYLDDDGDGYGQTGAAIVQCTQPAGYAAGADDCNDFDATVNPGASEICDGGIDNDCDGLGDGNDPDLQDEVTWYADADGDGYGDPAVSQIQCAQPGGYVANDQDCDDSSASVSPASIELCDGFDNDCDGLTDDADPGLVGASYWFDDVDGDGYGDPNNPTRACVQPIGLLPQAGDCDDADGQIFPGAPEVCDGVDNDCDTLVDDLDTNPVLQAFYRDNDGDGAGDPNVVDFACTAPGPDWVANDDDCDDAVDTVNPGAIEVCNFIDDDCDGEVDDDDPSVTGQPTWYLDGDGDGYGDLNVTYIGCEAGPGYVFNSTDCNDAQPLANPGNTLEWCNGYDDDCNGLADALDPAVLDSESYWPDADNDGFGDASGSPIESCDPTPPPGYAEDPDDCDDGNGLVNPGADEVCDGVDNNCSGQTDTDDGTLTNGVILYPDTDSDGQGDVFAPTLLCAVPGGFIANGDDCDDNDPTVGLGFPEVCDGVDNNCNGQVDEDAVDAPSWYPDVDEDGWGDNNIVVLECDPGPGWTTQSGDCQDGDPQVNPAAEEVCDGGLDNNCNGLADDADAGAVGQTFWYEDVDGDSFGDDANTFEACINPGGYANRAGDCDDSDSAVNPDADELCDGFDNDCDGMVDGDDDPVDGMLLYEDADGDTFGGDNEQQRCSGEPGWVMSTGDCDDTNDAVYPFFAPEVCDGVDNNCDGTVDDADPGVMAPTWYADFDGDGYGDSLFTQTQCTAPPLHVAVALDCDDSNADISPDAIEVCDTIDNDCDGDIDSGDLNVVGETLFYADGDLDGYGNEAVPFYSCFPQAGLASVAGDCNDGDPALYPGQVLTVNPFAGRWNTVSGAVNSACQDGVVRVTGGTYVEQIDFGGKRLTVRGSDPDNPPVIEGPTTPVVTAASQEPAGTALEDVILRAQTDGGVDGGGVRVANGAQLSLRGVGIEDIVIAGNGGGIYVLNGVVEVEGSYLVGNEATNGGGLMVNFGEATVVDSSFDENVAAGDGGGARVTEALLVVADSRFDANSAGAEGAAIAALGTTAVVGVYQTRFDDNLAGVQASIIGREIAELTLDGVGVYGGSAVYVESGAGPSPINILHTEVVGTSGTAISLVGAGLSAYLSNVVATGSTVHGILSNAGVSTLTQITAVGNAGAGVVLNDTTGSMSQSILQQNLADGLLVANYTGTVDYNLFGNATEATTYGGTNTFGDPLFLTFHPNLDPLLYDLHHSPAGAAWDAGDPAILDGDGTVSDLGAYGGPLEDMSFFVDSDGDSLVDGWELFWFGYLGEDGTRDMDFDGLDNLNELGLGTNPTAQDTDGDGSTDGTDSFPLDPGAQ